MALADEAYAYNNRINRISAVQEHYMIRRALDRGVPPERLAKALCVHEKHIRAKSTLLDGICSEAIEILSDGSFRWRCRRRSKGCGLCASSNA
ncbi:plasmid partitioning protein RepB C-terminal domain-containing protein [Variovorax sp. J22R24]|uniref:plasmid partitioning protein RepB C-terminal domain-containing protein n=1 Tax=Variovorax gracilis TaxID=3053502 RepID=UPI002576D926|nr:plasmid partitioning protein RepB C-terminal domain-containing protein [Variovorax sp. J22R24]MDM0110306.1 plasmid partitioning protein RepB C-terminal domain-containing protein [Variovorax sp. J22R24]